MLRIIVFVTAVLFALTGCDQNIERVRDGEMLEDRVAPAPGAAPPFAPFAMPGGESEVPPFVKAYFMHMFVEALYSPPQNSNPNPNWTSPLADAVNGRVVCTDCHISGSVDFTRIPKQRTPEVEEYEQDREFMVDLMRKWVGRLNSADYFAQAKLRQPVTCLTCHASNPAEGL